MKLAVSYTAMMLVAGAIFSGPLRAQNTPDRAKWDQWSEGVLAQSPVGATELRLRSALLLRPAAAAPDKFLFSVPEIALVQPETADVQIRDNKDHGYFLNLHSAHCSADPACSVTWAGAPAAGIGIRANDLWVLARGRTPDGSVLVLPACLCPGSALAADRTHAVQFTFVPIHPVNWAWEIYDGDNKLLTKSQGRNAASNVPLVVAFDPHGAHGRFRLVMHHVSASDSAVETTDDTFNFAIP